MYYGFLYSTELLGIFDLIFLYVCYSLIFASVCSSMSKKLPLVGLKKLSD